MRQDEGKNVAFVLNTSAECGLVEDHLRTQPDGSVEQKMFWSRFLPATHTLDQKHGRNAWNPNKSPEFPVLTSEVDVIANAAKCVLDKNESSRVSRIINKVCGRTAVAKTIATAVDKFKADTKPESPIRYYPREVASERQMLEAEGSPFDF